MRFAARSKVAPTTELFPMSKINDAIKHVRDGKARYRVVLKADFCSLCREPVARHLNLFGRRLAIC